MRNPVKILYEYLHTFKFPACDAWGIFQFKFQMFPMRILQYVPLGHCENKLVRPSKKQIRPCFVPSYCGKHLTILEFKYMNLL